VVVVPREYGLIEKPLGKITIFVHNNQLVYLEEIEEPGEESALHGLIYSGVNYYFDLEESGWNNRESGMYDLRECQIPGKKAFRASGI
jgi:hypothetical protein